MRPLVHPALARAWRDPATVQIGLDPARAVVIGGLGPAETVLFRSIDGARDERVLRDTATRAGGDAATADRLVDVLRTAGVLVDADRAAPDDPGDVLAPDRASLGLLNGSADGGAAALQTRHRVHVEVHGAGRVGATLARLLCAAGVGRVTVDDQARASAADVTPGGLGAHDVGRPRGVALEAALPCPDDLPGRDDSGQAPAIVVLAPSRGTARDEAAVLVRAGVTHLVARVVETTGIVGPLVVPGQTSCLRCHDLHRTDRDPAWPRILAQIERDPPGVGACDVTLAGLVGALAAQQALAHVDGFVPTTVDGTVEIRLPGGLPRRRSWRPHPACGCTWPP
ncbi:MAG: thiamine biosynthesis protein ThiF [Jiangellaceae bacterium]